MIRLSKFLRHENGASAAEFALVLPVALLFFLGIIDIGRYFWIMNEMEKAVQAGTRYAVATDVVAGGLNGADYTTVTCPGGGAVNPGDTICREALGTVTCRSGGSGVSCSCVQSQDSGGTAVANSCPGTLTPYNTAAFNSIVHRMQVIYGGIAPANVSVSYAGSGIGYAGDPAEDDAGAALGDVSPIVTVAVDSVRFRSMSLLGVGIRLPGFRYSQTLEDGDGAIAY